MKVTRALVAVAVVVPWAMVEGAGPVAADPLLCLGRVPTVVGTPGDDTILLNEETQPQVVVGLGGNDSILGTESSDSICGGDGNDQIWAGQGPDWLEGGAGDDRLLGGLGDDDLVYTASPNGVNVDLATGVATGVGDDIVDGEDVHGSEFADTITLASGVVGQEGIGNGGDDVLTGGDSADWLWGDLGNDVLYGGGGDDLIYGDPLPNPPNGGKDIIRSGPGRDRVFGGANEDSLFSGPEIDESVVGGAGTDSLYFDGIRGPLTIDLQRKQASFNGQVGAVEQVENVLGTPLGDTMRGNDGANRLTGGNGDDVIDGGSGPDRVEGGGGLDRVTGGDSTSVNDADRVDGGSEDDVLVGGPDNDSFIGGNGTDSCDGGPGTDTETMCETTTGIP